MGALPTPQPVYRYAPYIEELHEFFVDHHLYFGVPADIIPLIEGLEHPGRLRDEITAIILSILARETAGLSTAELLEIVALAIGGSRVFEPSAELNEPLSRLYDILGSILAQHCSETETSEVVTFPAVPETEVVVSPRPRRTLRFGGTTLDLPQIAMPGPSFRNLLLAGAFAVVVAIVLAVVLRPRSSAVHPVVSPTGTTAVHPAKPSPYGPAFNPTPLPRRHRSCKPATSPVPGTSVGQPANADR